MQQQHQKKSKLITELELTSYKRFIRFIKIHKIKGFMNCKCTQIQSMKDRVRFLNAIGLSK